MDLRLSHWISHKYLLLTLSLIDSWNCSIQIISKLSSVVGRSSVSVYQVSLWLIAPKIFQSKLDSVRIFLSKDSCVCKILYFVTLPALLTQPCWWYRPLDVQHSVTVPFQWLRHVRGTACRRLSGMHRRWRRSVASWRLYFSGRRLTMIRRSWLYCTV